MKIFVDTDSDIRLVRRLRRDITERGRDIEGVIKQYNKFVKPAFDQYIEPTMRLADIVVPRGTPILFLPLQYHVDVCHHSFYTQFSELDSLLLTYAFFLSLHNFVFAVCVIKVGETWWP